MFSFIQTILDPKALISAVGLIGIIVVIFLETGAFFGFFFPGDSLLFTAGYFASGGYLPIVWLLIGVFLAAVIGDSVGYAFGKKIGPAIFTREDSLLFNRKHVAKAGHFYEKYGGKTIILARFIPIIRTFAPIVAGIGNMEYKKFITYNIIGAFLWTWGMLLLGYSFGSFIPSADKYVIPAVLIIVAISAFPALLEIWRKRKSFVI